MSIEREEAPGLIDEPTNAELCDKEIAKLKASIGMKIATIEEDKHATFGEWWRVYPSVENYMDNLHAAWDAGSASRDAEVATLKTELRAISVALDDPRTDLTMTMVEVITGLREQVTLLRDAIEYSGVAKSCQELADALAATEPKK